MSAQIVSRNFAVVRIDIVLLLPQLLYSGWYAQPLMLLVLMLLVLMLLVLLHLVLVLLVLMGLKIHGKIKHYSWIFFRESNQNSISNIIYQGGRIFFITVYYKVHFQLAH